MFDNHDHAHADETRHTLSDSPVGLLCPSRAWLAYVFVCPRWEFHNHQARSIKTVCCPHLDLLIFNEASASITYYTYEEIKSIIYGLHESSFSTPEHSTDKSYSLRITVLLLEAPPNRVSVGQPGVGKSHCNIVARSGARLPIQVRL